MSHRTEQHGALQRACDDPVVIGKEGAHVPQRLLGGHARPKDILLVNDQPQPLHLPNSAM